MPLGSTVLQLIQTRCIVNNRWGVCLDMLTLVGSERRRAPGGRQSHQQQRVLLSVSHLSPIHLETVLYRTPCLARDLASVTVVRPPWEPQYPWQPQNHTSWDCQFPPLLLCLYLDPLLWVLRVSLLSLWYDNALIQLSNCPKVTVLKIQVCT